MVVMTFSHHPNRFENLCDLHHSVKDLFRRAFEVLFISVLANIVELGCH